LILCFDCTLCGHTYTERELLKLCNIKDGRLRKDDWRNFIACPRCSNDRFVILIHLLSKREKKLLEAKL